MKASILFLLLLFFSVNQITAQNVSFSVPTVFNHGTTTDKAINIARFKHNYFIAWKEISTGNVHVAFLGSQFPQSMVQQDIVIKGATTDFAPILLVAQNHIYVLWIAKDGTLQYAFNSSDNSFEGSTTQTVLMKNVEPLSIGLTATFTGNTIVVASHGKSKSRLLYAVCSIDKSGFLNADAFKKNAFKSADYPFVVALSASVIRFAYQDYKDHSVHYADLDIDKDVWIKDIQLCKVKSSTPPSIYKVFNASKLIYLWNGTQNGNTLFYVTEENGAMPSAATELPSYFTTKHSVSICDVDSNKAVLAYVGLDQQIYFSYCTGYNPARWMEEVLLPTKAGYSLQDIVLPGSHDAGMSVLTATGGQQSETINECNTLTQTQSIHQQLNLGIRMFDLRIGKYKNAFYTKHCSSDCMEDAIGGGYGEKFEPILTAIKAFLATNQKEIIVLSFSHFCEKEAPAEEVAKFLVKELGRQLIFLNNRKKLADITLNELAGKVVVSFEQYASSDKLIDSCSIAESSNCFINFRRKYAATNNLSKLIESEKLFFSEMEKYNKNDLIRLDWQLTQSSDEAAMVCNDFQSEYISPVINGAMLLTNVLRKHHSIKNMSILGNKSLLPITNKWIANGTIKKNNKPNILYVDVAGGWITDYCVQLNETALYTK